jgi:hypothetical protein
MRGTMKSNFLYLGKPGFLRKLEISPSWFGSQQQMLGLERLQTGESFFFLRNFNQHSGTVYFPYLYRSGQTFVVTNYNRPGNYACQFDTNVPRILPISNTQTVDPSVEDVRITKIEDLQPDTQLIAGEE